MIDNARGGGRTFFQQMARRGEIKIGWPFRKLREHSLLLPLLAKLNPAEEPLHIGWGYRPSGLAAKRAAGRAMLLEDALVRSLKTGTGTVYGLVADSQGMYFDATGSSDLICALNHGQPTAWMNPWPADPGEIEALICQFRRIRASKYNWYPGDFRTQERLPPGVLVVDQTKGDASLRHGGVSEGDFERMVKDALDEHPGLPVYVRSHPDHRYRGKHSCFPEWVFKESRVQLLPPDLSPASCFEFCREVYVGTSLMGMEALLHGCGVKAYGWNFYTGWGLTSDRSHAPTPPRLRKLSLTELFATAYLGYGHYFDPDDGTPCGLGRILDHLEFQQSIWQQAPGGRVTVGWTPWQRSLANDFLATPAHEVRHAASPSEAKEIAHSLPDARLLCWGGKPAPEGSAVMRVEDGFLRSTGLGAAFHRPLSWVVDDAGIYFDPRSPSRLEQLLNNADFSGNQLEQTSELLEFLRKHRLTKYNLTTTETTWDRSQAGGRKIILVPGQVDADASIACGSPEIRNNGALLRRVRECEPQAFLIYKAHPDLVAGVRHGAVLPESAESIADLVVTEGNVLDWLARCDEVHTMTSTVGFEALIRRVPVVTYGLPFYAGWGLTRDHLPCPRRIRRLTLDELACGALVVYPRYLNPFSGEFTTALRAAQLLSRPAAADRRAWYLKTILKLKKLWVELAR
jgi:capsular polysaccharide export protein